MYTHKWQPCKTCGQVFESKNPWHVYCDESCRPPTSETEQQRWAWTVVAKAKNAFEIVEPKNCEICGVFTAALRIGRKNPWGDMLHTHHWNGYNNPLDVWWICPSCHKRIRDRKIAHNGESTIEQVRAMLGYLLLEDV